MTGSPRGVHELGRDDDWSHVNALVTGFGVSGFAAADTLQHLGAHVTVVDEREPVDEPRIEEARLLETLGVDLRLGPGSTRSMPAEVDVVVTSPGWRPDSPVFLTARERDVPVWGEVELAWRLRQDGHPAGVPGPGRRDGHTPAPWLCVTGTNGKTTTVQMLDAILRAAGLRSAAVGNVGRPVLEAVMDPEPSDVLAVELSSYQLHWSPSVRAESAAVLNIAPDHLDWHGSFDAYVAAKGQVYHGVRGACVYNVADPVTEQLVRDADVTEGARAIGFTLGIPAPGMLGVVDDVLADRAFVENRHDSAAELASLSDLADPVPHQVENALAAAALARAHGVPAAAVREGLRSFRTAPHRIAEVAAAAGVRWVDDSKATNTHAAAASLRGVEHAVWIAGGQAKGATFDDLVVGARDRLRAAVLIGTDRDLVADALRRHAPDVPVVEVQSGEDDLMDRVVEAAATFAQPGDTVLLAPACASFDQFASYGARGDAFAGAVRRYLGQE